MKHLLIAAGVFALCLALGLLSVFSVRTVSAQTADTLIRASESAQREDFLDAETQLLRASATWEDSARLLGIFLHHEQTDEITALFAQLRVWAREQDRDDFLALCSELRARLDHLAALELPTPENIL